ncbi:MAG: hypothetical protein OSP8Acid_00750 [uncultured Acidilobus sp. OSP8]|jgi:hypothetical protein|nr:MAG: hypothetical protein OSP8Acid_00750 [uncultured Acidilobus sp. OSP8]
MSCFKPGPSQAGPQEIYYPDLLSAPVRDEV